VSAQPLHAVPTNIITGFLGSGKTTAINHLLKHKPDGERWAVLVNEFGQVGIDGSLIRQQDGIEVKELAGGCLCCALGPSLPITLATLLRRFRPDRLLIEPTGLGHPARIVDTLQGEHFASVLDLRSIICLLDPAVLHQPEVLQQPGFLDQLNLADVIVLNRTDLAAPNLTQEAIALSHNMFPPKQGVFSTTQGQLQPDWLDLVHDGQLKAQFPQAHVPRAGTASVLAPPHVQEQPGPIPGHPLCRKGQAQGYFSYGWVFSAEDRFDYSAISTFLDRLQNAVRIKAALAIGHTWIGYNRNRGDTAAELNELAWRRDSRIEILTDQPLDSSELEQSLLRCLQ
jgi:G3E family GTPase